jgi:hypothetical protein
MGKMGEMWLLEDECWRRLEVEVEVEVADEVQRRGNLARAGRSWRRIS